MAIIKIGEKYGILTIVKEVERKVVPSGKIKRMVLFSCDCGKSKIIHYHNVKNGKTRSCELYNVNPDYFKR